MEKQFLMICKLKTSTSWDLKKKKAMYYLKDRGDEGDQACPGLRLNILESDKAEVTVCGQTVSGNRAEIAQNIQ